MTGALNVRFEPFFLVRSGASIPVTLTREASEAAPKGTKPDIRTLMVPLGASGLEVPQLPTGLWCVQATLPNGQKIGTSVEIGPGPEKAEAVLFADFPSPNEDAAWAYVLQAPTRARNPTPGLGRGLSFSRAPTLESVDRGFVEPRLSLRPARGGREGASARELPESSPVSARARPNRDPDALFEGDLDVPADRSWWLVATSPEHTTRWRVPPSPQGGRTRFLLRADSGDSRDPFPWQASFDFGNDRATTLISYLQGGALDAARHTGLAFLREAIELLGGKYTDLSSAFAAGYFLKRAADWTVGQTIGGLPARDLGSWLGNMDRDFQAHSDGAVLHGCWLLDNARPAEARQAFLRAASRPLPIFTMGLRALTDGLQYLYAARAEGSQDEEVATALTWLGGAVRASDADAMVTCLAAL